jgi:hypothetical protein
MESNTWRLWITTPNSIRHMSRGWAYGMNPKERHIFLVGMGHIVGNMVKR